MHEQIQSEHQKHSALGCPEEFFELFGKECIFRF